MALINLLIQLILLISVTLMPASSNADSKTHQEMIITGELYTLKKGETIAQIAKRFGLSVAELHALNQHREYPAEFTELSSGQQIIVSLSRQSSSTEGKR